MNGWRLILDDAGDGVWNMAVDAVLLDARSRDESPPTLRLYRWRRPSVSLGRFQDPRDVDPDAVRESGVDIVRRPTGGRGVLHDDELTYSVVAAVEDGLPRGVLASYRVLSEALARAYRRLGVPAELTSRPRGNRSTGACYLHATHADLSLGPAKLSGSAQVWKADACLQHGSFVRSRDVAREARIFRLDAEAATRLRDTTATLDDLLDQTPSVDAIVEAVIAAFEESFGMKLDLAGLSAAERTAAEAAAEAFAVTL